MIHAILRKFTWDNFYRVTARFLAGFLILSAIGACVWAIAVIIAQSLKDTRVWLWFVVAVLSYLIGHYVYRNSTWEDNYDEDDPWAEERKFSPPPPTDRD